MYKTVGEIMLESTLKPEAILLAQRQYGRMTNVCTSSARSLMMGTAEQTQATSCSSWTGAHGY